MKAILARRPYMFSNPRLCALLSISGAALGIGVLVFRLGHRVGSAAVQTGMGITKISGPTAETHEPVDTLTKPHGQLGCQRMHSLRGVFGPRTHSYLLILVDVAWDSVCQCAHYSIQLFFEIPLLKLGNLLFHPQPKPGIRVNISRD